MLSIELYPNDSPLRGSEGRSSNINQLRDRLIKESENDVALRIDPVAKNSRSIKVTGRGDLHLGVLFENMRREGLEFMVTPPQIITRAINGVLYEPVEKVVVEVNEVYERGVIDLLQVRKASLVDCEKTIKGNDAYCKLVFEITSRGFIGCRSAIMSDTRGTAIIHTEFLKYDKFKGSIAKTSRGAIIAMTEGKATAYALAELERKGKLFIEPGNAVYPGTVIGEHNLEADVEVNPCKQKRVTNVRTHTHDEKILLAPAKKFSIDEALSYIREDEVVEVTPKSIRIRKKTLDSQLRRRMRKNDKYFESQAGESEKAGTHE
eukprot:TRINITY_DN2083_c0_g2_i9.p1 TRINITY_DN2083_c0_g2~~TRINITY_DN2083_c0_g2_i9.p1  ORF type:complete len:320 (-),score=95.20 TRINITY_DN2083_c0_g2_i9:48-1007(-)